MTILKFASNGLLEDMANRWLNGGATAVYKLMLLSDQYTPSEEDRFRSEVVAYETSGTGYSSGGTSITFTVGSIDQTNNLLYITCPGANWPNSTITAKFAWAYRAVGTAATDRLIGLFQLGETSISTTGTTFSIGPMRITFSNQGPV